jgi:hypothetical protein
VCGQLKPLLYSGAIERYETLQKCIFDACKTTSNRLGSFKILPQVKIRIVRVCIVSGGGNFEYLL